MNRIPAVRMDSNLIWLIDKFPLRVKFKVYV